MKPWMILFVVLAMATGANAQRGGRGGGMGGGMGRGMGARPQMSSPGIRNIPPVVSPTIPHNSIRNIPPVVRPTIPTNPGFSVGLGQVGRAGFGRNFRGVNPGFGAFAAGQSVYPYSGYYPYSYASPYGYSYPYPSSSYPFTYVPPLTTVSPYYDSPVYPQPTVTPSYEPSYQPQPTDALVGEIQALQDQVQALSDELAMRSKPEPPPEPRVPEPPVILVFRDGHRLETHGYAIMGTMLWAIDGANVSKFPLSDLNIAATQTENQKRGIEFKVPE